MVTNISYSANYDNLTRLVQDFILPRIHEARVAHIAMPEGSERCYLDLRNEYLNAAFGKSLPTLLTYAESIAREPKKFTKTLKPALIKKIQSVLHDPEGQLREMPCVQRREELTYTGRLQHATSPAIILDSPQSPHWLQAIEMLIAYDVEHNANLLRSQLGSEFEMLLVRALKMSRGTADMRVPGLRG